MFNWYKRNLVKLFIISALVSSVVCPQYSMVVYAENSQTLNNENLEKTIDAIAFTYVRSTLAEKNNKAVPGAQIAILKDGELVFSKGYGNLQSFDFTGEEPKEVENPVVVTNQTLFDLASVTKIAATTQAMMKLVYEGKVNLDDKVIKYLPNFGKNGKSEITIGELLSHTSGLPQWKAIYLYSDNKEDTLKYIENQELEFSPGEYKYSDLGFMTLGFIIEEVTGVSLDEYVKNEIYTPLGLDLIIFKPNLEEYKGNIATTSFGNPFEKMMIDEKNFPEFGYDMTNDSAAFEQFDSWRNYALIGEVNDGNAAMANNGVAGHAGLFANAESLAKLFQLMNTEGMSEGMTIYNQDTINQFLTDVHKSESGMIQSYGFWKTNSWLSELSDDAIGHNGFTGTYVSISPKNNLVVVLLTNKMNNGQTEKGYYNNINDFASALNFAVKNELIGKE